jgi:regulator of sigma E protease
MDISSFLGDASLFVVAFIILLGPLMFVHELGHFIAAKRAGIRVEEFGMGLPPRAVTLARRGETLYTLNWLPIGAFVRMTGEEDPTDSKSFAAQPKRWRFLTLVAGPGMNFLAAILILFCTYQFFAFRIFEARYVVAKVNSGEVAAQMGMQEGDIILSANGVDMYQRPDPKGDGQVTTAALREQSLASRGKTLTVQVLRRDPQTREAHTVELKGAMPAGINSAAPLGITLDFEILKAVHEPYTFARAISDTVNDVGNTLSAMVNVPLDLIRGRLTLEQARPVGPVGITTIGVAMLRQIPVVGPFPFLRLAGLISLILGLTNLLPIPALDGGRILFVLIEWIRGRRVDPMREQWVHGIGMIVLLALSAVILVIDIVNPIR